MCGTLRRSSLTNAFFFHNCKAKSRGITATLFQKFSRAEDASKANILGTGLGLYVARQLIEAQKGTVRAESEGEGKGSTFIVELPTKG
mgnify:CR=1 FL=1